MPDQPYMPLWTDAYLADTPHLSNEEHGVYLRLLMFSWRSPNCDLPNDDNRLRKIVGLSIDEWLEMKETIMEFFSIENDRIVQKRLRSEKDRVSKMRERGAAAGRRSAQKRKENMGQGELRVDVDQEQHSGNKDMLDCGSNENPTSVQQEHVATSVQPKSNKSYPYPDPYSESLSKEKDKSAARPPVEEATEAFSRYNAMADRIGLPSARDLTETRKKAIRKRLESGGMPIWDEVLNNVERSDFLTGKNDRGFKASLDWILKPANFQKILENNYENRTKKPDREVDKISGALEIVRRFQEESGSTTDNVKQIQWSESYDN